VVSHRGGASHRAGAPPLLFIEIINVAGRRWRFEARQLKQLAATLPDLGLELVEPDLGAVARWTARGVTAYDATYLAVAEQTGATLVSDDEELVHTAPELTRGLGVPTS
jgi:predicted nucleic acid-binding protein